MRFPFRPSSTLALRTLSVAGALAGLTACDNPLPSLDANIPDGGNADVTMTDAPRDAPVIPGVCESSREVTLTIGANTVTGNTTGRGQDLDLTCGDAASAQEAIELVVPGAASAMMGVSIDLATDGTADTFDTILEIRANCGSASGAACSDDSNGDPRSAANFVVPGGTRLFAIVSGFNAAAVGAWEASIEVVENPAAPVLTGSTVRLVDGADMRGQLTATDANSDIAGFIVEFLDGDVVIGVDLDMDIATPPTNEFNFGFTNDVDGMSPIAGDVLVRGLDEIPELGATTDYRFRVVDRFGLESEPMTFPVVEATSVGIGEACDDTIFCGLAFECTAGMCALPAAVATACGTATEVTLVAPTGDERTEMVIDTAVDAGEGVLVATCQAETLGRETFFDVVVPAGNFDLVIGTENARTGDTDTVVYVMNICGDNISTPDDYCHDDIDLEGMNFASLVEIQNIEAGTYSVALETWQRMMMTASVDVGLSFSLRPVLEAGDTCDPMGVLNRCGGAACTAAGMCP